MVIGSVNKRRSVSQFILNQHPHIWAPCAILDSYPGQQELYPALRVGRGVPGLHPTLRHSGRSRCRSLELSWSVKMLPPGCTSLVQNRSWSRDEHACFPWRQTTYSADLWNNVIRWDSWERQFFPFGAAKSSLAVGSSFRFLSRSLEWTGETFSELKRQSSSPKCFYEKNYKATVEKKPLHWILIAYVEKKRISLEKIFPTGLM